MRPPGGSKVGAWLLDVLSDPQEFVDKQCACVPDSEVMHIVHDNAARSFGLTV